MSFLYHLADIIYVDNVKEKEVTRMSVNLTLNNESYGLIQRNSRLHAIGKSMEGKRLDETKKLTGGVIVPRTKASVSFDDERLRDFLLLPNFEIFKNEGSTYVLNGVKFSESEMAAVKQVVQSATSIVPRGNLDYCHYANMGIAQNMVRSYGKEHLTEEQADVINRAVSEYFDQLVENEPEPTEVIEGLYYGKRQAISQKMREYGRNFIANGNLPAYVKQQLLANMGDGRYETGGVVISASDQKLANSLRTRFAAMDWENKDEVQSAFEQYKKWMYPAYMELNGGFGNVAKITLDRDIEEYKMKYGKLMDVIKAVSVPHVDVQV